MYIIQNGGNAEARKVGRCAAIQQIVPLLKCKSSSFPCTYAQMQGERTKTEMAIDYVTQKMNLHTGLCMSSAIPISTRTERNRPDK
jgi:hypothetical protein